MIDMVTTAERLEATISGHRRCHVLRAAVAPEVGESVKLTDPSGRACFARVTFVETYNDSAGAAPIHVISLDVRMSTDRMPAVQP